MRKGQIFFIQIFVLGSGIAGDLEGKKLQTEYFRFRIKISYRKIEAPLISLSYISLLFRSWVMNSEQD